MSPTSAKHLRLLPAQIKSYRVAEEMPVVRWPLAVGEIADAPQTYRETHSIANELQPNIHFRKPRRHRTPLPQPVSYGRQRTYST